ncbi:major facilitator superfamily domain-containing protein [Talaromyces proteolyticus]|uniref:Major facilitator superfamily domain-containing protein n=1 Tax=Talaromyces proteolyticus TaxID=1131652 RepID=A0AAD4KIQ6_9EURO|nr:major facilitator superfamily domain-containing protein [Talaromyces proteolyticus]KAH8693158.1 major facilitator superfamily domain-containing protein [Talaromyces proteolyticus]
MSSQPQESIRTMTGSEKSAERTKREAVAASVPVVESAPRDSGFFHNIDGGIKGWSAVLGAWLFQFSMVGAVTAFGSYQTFYEATWLDEYSESSIAWIGSLQLFLEFFLGVFGGLLLDAGRWRLTVGGGSILFVFTFFMLSLCKRGQYAPIILAQGIGLGAGLGFAYLPVSGIVSQHFTKRRSLAMGIITTGTSLGGFTFSVLTSKLLTSSLGFSWTVRVSAFIALGSIVLGNLLVSQPEKTLAEDEKKSINTKGNPAVETGSSPEEKDPSGAEEAVEEKGEKPRSISELLRDPAYLAIISSGFIVCLGLYFPMFAIQSFALEHGISPGLASWLLSIINLSGVLGRTIPNWMADHFGTLELYVPCTAAGGALIFALGGATNPGSIIVVCILYGFFSGSIVSLYFPTVCALDPDVTSTGVRLGIACLPVGIASLVGTPIAEALVGRENHWWHGLAFAGTAEMVSAALLAFAWVVETKRKMQRRS